MNLYLVNRDVGDKQWDVYDSLVVCERSVEGAKKINIGYERQWVDDHERCHLKVKYIGKAGSKVKKGVVHSSFVAG